MDSDDLFPIRSALYTGNIARLQEEAESAVGLTDDQEVIKDSYLMRGALSCEQYAKVGKKIKDNDSASMQVLKLFAAYKLSKNEGEKELVLEQLAEWITPEAKERSLFRVNAALLYAEAKEWSKALLLVQRGENLEELAIATHVYIAIFRMDKAEKMVQQMKNLDDDDPLTALASVWVMLAKGLSDEPILLLQELTDKCGESAMLKSLESVCHLHKGDEGNLKEAFECIKQSMQLRSAAGLKNDPNTMLNMTTVLLHLKKDSHPKGKEKLAQLQRELEANYPDNAMLMRNRRLDELFTKSAATHSVA